MKLGCILMAAGQGSRFGANKLLALFRGRPLYQWALEAIPQDLFTTVVVTGYRPILESAAARGFETVYNDQPQLGVSRTIRLGLEALPDCSGVLFMTADQPWLSTATVEKLAAEFERHPQAIVAAGHNGKKGNPCLFPRELVPELRQLQGDHGGSRVIKAHPEKLLLVEVPEPELQDCDTAEQLHEIENMQTPQ